MLAPRALERIIRHKNAPTWCVFVYICGVFCDMDAPSVPERMANRCRGRPPGRPAAKTPKMRWRCLSAVGRRLVCRRMQRYRRCAVCSVGAIHESPAVKRTKMPRRCLSAVGRRLVCRRMTIPMLWRCESKPVFLFNIFVCEITPPSPPLKGEASVSVAFVGRHDKEGEDAPSIR